MGSPWRRAKVAFSQGFLGQTSRDTDDARNDDEESTPPRNSSATTTPAVSEAEASECLTPVSGSSSSSRTPSSKKVCAICLGSIRTGHGHALFVAECSHTFHFPCIVSNVKHGNLVCPICRATWKEIPTTPGRQSSEHSHDRSRVNTASLNIDELLASLPPIPPAAPHRFHHVSPPFNITEPEIFNDDEPVCAGTEVAQGSQPVCPESVQIKAYTEFPSIGQSVSKDSFTILIHLAAPHSIAQVPYDGIIQAHLSTPFTSRAPIDLVTLLDISGSMTGMKIRLLKQAMAFVIENLGPSDRLSVVAFSSSAWRLFPLCLMSEAGKLQALRKVDALTADGGTNIAEGLRKAVKVIEERRERNPVASIILLSDGRDNSHSSYNISASNRRSQRSWRHYQSALPSSIQGRTSNPIPVHSFGFGVDHDSACMHWIAEASGGTFSFIEAANVMQDAFAQCIGGLLSIVVQEMLVKVECVHPGVYLRSIKSGSYPNHISDGNRTGSISIENMYADEHKDFLLTVSVPVQLEETTLIRVGCTYKNPSALVSIEDQEISIERPEIEGSPPMSIEVDRQRNRIEAAEAMADARVAAEQGDLSRAAGVLGRQRKLLARSAAARSGDRLCAALDAEMKEMQERMASSQQYEESGRAYVLSGLSSHSAQRATARGDSTESTSRISAYQTPSMVDMLKRSQSSSPSKLWTKQPDQPNHQSPPKDSD